MNRRKRSNQSGQATVEFALTLLLLMAFILFYLQLSLMFAWGNFVHYATFMSARAYLSAGPSLSDQQERARNVIVRMLKRKGSSGTDRIPFIAKGEGGTDVAGFLVDPPSEFNPTDRNSSWMQGVRYTFKSRVFLLPLAGKIDGSVNSVTLTSESWLGREPTYEDCAVFMDNLGITDNGC